MTREELISTASILIMTHPTGRLRSYILKYRSVKRDKWNWRVNISEYDDINKWPNDSIKHFISYLYSFCPPVKKRKIRVIEAVEHMEKILIDVDDKLKIDARLDFIRRLPKGSLHKKRKFTKGLLIVKIHPLNEWKHKELVCYRSWLERNIPKYRGIILGRELNIF